MAKRWLHTLDLSLDVSKWKNSARWKLAHAVMAAHPSPTELTQLQLEWFETQQDDSSEDEDSEEEHNLANEENLAQNSATGLLLLTWLAAHARGIQTLYLRICSLHSLPPLLNLRHLVLDCAVLKVPQNLPHDLALMTELQTLCIRAGSQRDEDELPDLSVLASLKHLRQLRLEGLVPHSLSLLPEAELHVLVYSHWSARHPVWHSVLPMLRSFAWDAWRLQDNRLHRKIPVVLKMPNSLTSVFLRTSKMGYGHQPLQMEQLSLSPPGFLSVVRMPVWISGAERGATCASSLSLLWCCLAHRAQSGACLAAQTFTLSTLCLKEQPHVLSRPAMGTRD